MTPNRLKQIINACTAIAVTIVVSLIIVMIILININGNLASRERMLEQELARYKQQTTDIEQEIEYRKSAEYIEKYAREELGLVSDGSSKYVPKATSK